VGWRQIIENMHKNATVAEWYKTHGKHEIYAKGKTVNSAELEHSLKIDAEDAARVRTSNTTFGDRGGRRPRAPQRPMKNRPRFARFEELC